MSPAAAMPTIHECRPAKRKRSSSKTRSAAATRSVRSRAGKSQAKRHSVPHQLPEAASPAPSSPNDNPPKSRLASNRASTSARPPGPVVAGAPLHKTTQRSGPSSSGVTNLPEHLYLRSSCSVPSRDASQDHATTSAYVPHYLISRDQRRDVDAYSQKNGSGLLIHNDGQPLETFTTALGAPPIPDTPGQGRWPGGDFLESHRFNIPPAVQVCDYSPTEWLGNTSSYLTGAGVGDINWQRDLDPTHGELIACYANSATDGQLAPHAEVTHSYHTYSPAIAWQNSLDTPLLNPWADHLSNPSLVPVDYGIRPDDAPPQYSCPDYWQAGQEAPYIINYTPRNTMGGGQDYPPPTEAWGPSQQPPAIGHGQSGQTDGKLDDVIGPPEGNHVLVASSELNGHKPSAHPRRSFVLPLRSGQPQRARETTGVYTVEGGNEKDDDYEIVRRLSLSDLEPNPSWKLDLSSPSQNDELYGGKRRGRLRPGQRKETADVRKLGSCIRCREQKAKCVVNQDNPDLVCGTCQSITMLSKKTIRRIGCYRIKLTQAVLFRKGGLNLTQRWHGIEVRDVADRPHPRVTRTIEVTDGFCDTPLRVDVVEYTPVEGDATARVWTVLEDGHEVRRIKELARYCLADVHKTSKVWELYISQNAIPTLLKQQNDLDQKESPDGRPGAHIDLTHRTYMETAKQYCMLQTEISPDDSDSLQVHLLGKMFMLWFAMRHTTGSTWICGEDTLGMEPETADETYPLIGRVSLPRMITAQFDSILYSKILDSYGQLVLADLEACCFLKSPKAWWSTYASMFILLREAAWITADRYRHARNNYGSKLRYSLPNFVENLHEGCNILLTHWHYFNGKYWTEWPDLEGRNDTELSGLTAEQHGLLVATRKSEEVESHLAFWKQYKEENGLAATPEPEDLKSEDSETPMQAGESSTAATNTTEARDDDKMDSPETPMQAGESSTAATNTTEARDNDKTDSPEAESPESSGSPPRVQATVEYSGSQNRFDWDHPYYWVAQLFEPTWGPHPTYNRESL